MFIITGFIRCLFVLVMPVIHFHKHSRGGDICLKVEQSSHLDQGPVSQRVTSNRTIDINHSSMANHVIRKLAINRNPL